MNLILSAARECLTNASRHADASVLRVTLKDAGPGFLNVEFRNDGKPPETAVREGGGTNASMICLSDKGTPVIVISIPVRYIHSHNCIASMSDFDAAVELAVAVIKSLDKDIVDSF